MSAEPVINCKKYFAKVYKVIGRQHFMFQWFSRTKKKKKIKWYFFEGI